MRCNALAAFKITGHITRANLRRLAAPCWRRDSAALYVQQQLCCTCPRDLVMAAGLIAHNPCQIASDTNELCWWRLGGAKESQYQWRQVTIVEKACKPDQRGIGAA